MNEQRAFDHPTWDEANRPNESELSTEELEKVVGGAPFNPTFEDRLIVDPLPEKIRRKRRREKHALRRQARE